jgi:hypothetical protein
MKKFLISFLKKPIDDFMVSYFLTTLLIFAVEWAIFGIQIGYVVLLCTTLIAGMTSTMFTKEDRTTDLSDNIFLKYILPGIFLIVGFVLLYFVNYVTNLGLINFIAITLATTVMPVMIIKYFQKLRDHATAK